MLDEKTLQHTLEKLLVAGELFRERFGGQTTVDGVITKMYAHWLWLCEEEVTLSTLARLSAVPKSSVAYHIKNKPYLRVSPHPLDDRKKVITIDDLASRVEYITHVRGLMENNYSN